MTCNFIFTEERTNTDGRFFPQGVTVFTGWQKMRPDELLRPQILPRYKYIWSHQT